MKLDFSSKYDYKFLLEAYFEVDGGVSDREQECFSKHSIYFEDDTKWHINESFQLGNERI